MKRANTFSDLDVLLEKNVNRKSLSLDCDFICSTTLSASNVYGCLFCGKFFQGNQSPFHTSNFLGRGKESPAYMHALQEDHQLYICLTSLDYKVYQLPENIEIESPLLDDIKVRFIFISVKTNSKSLRFFQSLRHPILLTRNLSKESIFMESHMSVGFLV